MMFNCINRKEKLCWRRLTVIEKVVFIFMQTFYLYANIILTSVFLVNLYKPVFH